MPDKPIEFLNYSSFKKYCLNRVMMHFKNGWACMKKVAIPPLHSAKNQSLLNLENNIRHQ